VFTARYGLDLNINFRSIWVFAGLTKIVLGDSQVHERCSRECGFTALQNIAWCVG
jgi:hypothetical protein